MVSKRRKHLQRRQGRKREQSVKRYPGGQPKHQRDDGTAELRAKKFQIAQACRNAWWSETTEPLRPEATAWPIDRLWRDEVVKDNEYAVACEYRELHTKCIGGTGAGRSNGMAGENPEEWRRFKRMQAALPPGPLRIINSVVALGEWRPWIFRKPKTSEEYMERVALIGGLAKLARVR